MTESKARGNGEPPWSDAVQSIGLIVIVAFLIWLIRR